MDTKDIILELRTKRGLSQEDLAEKVFVTRQAVSRWEVGTALPDANNILFAITACEYGPIAAGALSVANFYIILLIHLLCTLRQIFSYPR